MAARDAPSVFSDVARSSSFLSLLVPFVPSGYICCGLEFSSVVPSSGLLPEGFGAAVCASVTVFGAC